MVVANNENGGNASSSYTPTVVAQIRYLLQWFGEWSEMERGDFLPVLVYGFSADDGGDDDDAAVNGQVLPILDSIRKEDGRPLSLFKCRIKLFTEWVRSWSADDKDSFMRGVRAADAEFADRYDRKAVEPAANSPERCNGVNRAAVNGDDRNPEQVI